ncbi:hypothetical protein [Pseudomonas baetica]|uniref:hypothetical protein n=1 Tax=Pseudomonas baetica TaxID=674054 RepID=UPI002404CCFC|nr:hypothetical protein [Pseudomonas baetica]MDF9778914.1 hypothetical protein [Pseudomonas baetica]
MFKIEDCISLTELSESLAFMTPTARGEVVPQIDFVEIPNISKDEFATLHAYVLDTIADLGGVSFLSLFNSFEGFYDWLDTVEHHEQEDTETSLADHLPWLAFIFIDLKRGYQYLDAKQAQHGPMICASCGDQILTGQYRVSEQPEAYVVEHRNCCDHDPSWMLVDKEQRDKKAYAAEYVQACKAFQLKWNTTALDDEIARFSF